MFNKQTHIGRGGYKEVTNERNTMASRQEVISFSYSDDWTDANISYMLPTWICMILYTAAGRWLETYMNVQVMY